jgi:hypothetical protein
MGGCEWERAAEVEMMTLTGPHDATRPRTRHQLIAHLAYLLDVDLARPVPSPVTSAIGAGTDPRAPM